MQSGEKTNAGVDSNSSDNDEGIAWDKASGEATPPSMQQQKTPCMQSLLFIWYQGFTYFTWQMMLAAVGDIRYRFFPRLTLVV